MSKFNPDFSFLNLKDRKIFKFLSLEFFRKWFSKTQSRFYLSRWQGLSFILLLVLTVVANLMFIFSPELLRGASFLNQNKGPKNFLQALVFRKNFRHKGQGGASHYSQRGHKKILQVWEGPFIEYGLDSIKILKVQQGDQLSLEFLSKQVEGSYRFINSVPLEGIYEAFYSYLDNKKNKEGLISLAVFDQDGDGKSEVIAPSFSQFLRPYVNVIGYDQELKKFYLKLLPTTTSQKAFLPKVNQRL